MSNEFTVKDKLTFKWVVTNVLVFVGAVLGTCYHYQPAANITRFLVVVYTVMAIAGAGSLNFPGPRFDWARRRLAPRSLEIAYDILFTALLASHGWFVMASFWLVHITAIQWLRYLKDRPLTAADRGKAMVYYYGNQAGVERDERLPYLLADLQISEGDKFVAALHKSYVYAASEETDK